MVTQAVGGASLTEVEQALVDHVTRGELLNLAADGPVDDRAMRALDDSFALHRWIDSPRIVKTADYGPRWRGHFILIRAEQDLDDELSGWLQESHDTVGQQADLHPRTP